MAKFLEAKVGAKIPIIDRRIKNIIQFSANCQLDSIIICYFEKCFKAIADQLEYENMLEQNIPHMTCIALDNDILSLEVEENVYGIIMSLAIYPVSRWDRLSEIQICTCILEEICHCLWCMYDELEITFKVFEVMKRIYPSVKIFDLYNINWIHDRLNEQNKTLEDFGYKE